MTVKPKIKLETLPLFSTTAKIIKFYAFLIDDHWRCYFFLIITLILNVLQVIYLILSDSNMTHLVVNLFLSVLWMSANMRTIVLVTNQKEMNGFLEEIYLLYMDIMKNGDTATRNMLEATTESSRRFANFNFILGLFSCCGMISSCFMGSQRELMFDMYLPFYEDRKLETPCYEILFTIQIGLLPVGYCMFVTFINLMIALVSFIICLCQILQNELKNQVVGDETTAVDKKLIKCINFHILIADYVNRINKLTTYAFSVEFVCFGALLCVLLFLLVLVRTFYEQLIITAYIIMCFVQLAIIYFCANRLYFESLAVADAAYDTNWYDYTGKARMTLQLMIQRAQNPICLTMGNFHPMTIEVLKTLLNFTYSYFTILKNMVE